MGVFKLGIAKGFLTLVYFAFSRKTYTAQGPIALWAEMFQASPWEFALLVPGTIAAFVLWRRFPEKRELLPWLAFIGFFLIVTLKMTLQYPYYYAPLTAAFSVVTGVVFSVLWERWPWPGRVALLAATAVSIVGSTTAYREVLRSVKAVTPYESVVLRVLGSRPVGPGKIYLPYQLVPMMHYYRPEIATVGYDLDYPLARLADGIESADAAPVMLCEAVLCDGLERLTPGFAVQKILLDSQGPNHQRFYLIETRKSGSL